MAFATPHRAQARQVRRARPRRAKPRLVARPSRSRRDVEMVLFEALGWQQAELTAWVETMGTPTPRAAATQRSPPPPPAVDALRRDCIREKFAAAVDCDKSFLEDYAVFLAARSAVSPPERRPRDHVRENASAHPGARAAASRERETTKVQSSVLASARATVWRTPPRKPAREWRVTSRSPERAPRPPRPPSFSRRKSAREPSPCPRTPSPRPRRSPSEVHVDARLALLDEITRPETPPPAPEVSAPQSTPSAADGGSPSTSVNTNAALRALLKQKDAQIAALTAQLVGPAPRRPPVPQTTPPKTPSGNVSIARQSPRKRHGALLGQIRDLHLAHAPPTRWAATDAAWP